MKLKNKMFAAVLAAFTAMLFSVQAYAYNDTAIDSYSYFNNLVLEYLFLLPLRQAAILF